jgi:hypothetical protein
MFSSTGLFSSLAGSVLSGCGATSSLTGSGDLFSIPRPTIFSKHSLQ